MILATISACSSFGRLAISAAADTEARPASMASTSSGTPCSVTVLAWRYVSLLPKPAFSAAT